MSLVRYNKIRAIQGAGLLRQMGPAEEVRRRLLLSPAHPVDVRRRYRLVRYEHSHTYSIKQHTS